MSVYAIGDTHLSFSVDKPMDIFKGWDDYAQRIENNWQHLISNEDTVIINGDISWAMGIEQAEKDLEFLNKLNGIKIISKGNHDYWWNTITKMEKFCKEKGFDSIKFLHNNAYKVGEIAIAGTRGWFFDAEKDNVDKVMARECARLQRSIDEAKKLGGEVVVFLHYPPVSTAKVCEPIMNILKENNIERCYYGHLHGGAINGAINEVYDGIKFQLISADYLNFCPLFINK
ncbi:MAG: metallophosphoesterase [Clostridia bacterium]|nr:metallophosphoesterase [Clostridia bacterium]